MLAENARPFTSAPNESAIGSSPLQPTPVDFPACGSRCVLQGVTANRKKRRRYCIPSDRLIGTVCTRCQSLLSSQTPYNFGRLPPNPETCSKSVDCLPAAPH